MNEATDAPDVDRQVLRFLADQYERMPPGWTAARVVAGAVSPQDEHSVYEAIDRLQQRDLVKIDDAAGSTTGPQTEVRLIPWGLPHGEHDGGNDVLIGASG